MRLDAGLPGQSGKIAYVYRGNTLDATSFQSLLVAKGYTVTLVPLSAVLIFLMLLAIKNRFKIK